MFKEPEDTIPKSQLNARNNKKWQKKVENLM